MISRKWRLRGLAVAAAVFLSGCASDVRQDYLAEPDGPAARDIQGLWNLVIGIAGIVFVIVLGGVVFIIWRFREKPGDTTLPKQLHGHVKAEIGWTILPAVVLAAISIPTVAGVFSLQNRVDTAEMEIEVFAQQWWWEFRYEVDGQIITTANELVFPAGVNISLQLESRDVIHSFWLPTLNGKKDVVPGRTHTLSIEADEPGVFWGQCTEFCGLSHADMRIRGVALSQEDWDTWIASQLDTTFTVPMPASVAAGRELFANNCARCHVIDGEFEGAGEGRADLVSGHAPNLTNLMSRTGLAANVLDLYNADGTVNTADLFDWVRDAPSVKPMAPDEGRGMPSFADALSAKELTEILDYLQTLGDAPLLPAGVELEDTLRR